MLHHLSPTSSELKSNLQANALETEYEPDGEGERGKGFCGNNTIQRSISPWTSVEDHCGQLGLATSLGSSVSPARENELGETWEGRFWKHPLKPDPGGPGRVKGHLLEACHPQVTRFVIFPKAQVQVNLPERGQMQCSGWGLRQERPSRGISESEM